MDTTMKPKPPQTLILTAVFSGSLTLTISLIYLVLCIIALIFHFDCETTTGSTISGSAFLVTTVYRVYFQSNECDSSITQPDITTDYSVLVMVCITLSASFLCIVAAFTLIAAVLSSGTVTQYLNIIIYGYIGVCVASLVVDVTLASHFGVDYSHVSSIMDNFNAGMPTNYELDMIRTGALLLMFLALKGFVSHAVNIALLVLMVIYLIQYAKALNEYEHSIHKLGVINAFDPKRPRDEPMNQSNTPAFLGNGGPQMNYGYMNDDEPPRSLTREHSRRDRDRDDFSSAPSFDRSYSWQAPAPVPAPRPFSYLEDTSRRPPPSPAVEPQWRRNQWPGAPPPVPAPDYSPQTPRRLKSALKPGYM